MEYLTNVSGVDPTTVQRISVSEMNTLRRCTKEYDYKYRQGLEPIETPTYFTKGTYLHKLMQAYLLAHASGSDFDIDSLSADIQREILAERDATVTEPDRLEVNHVLGEWLKLIDPNSFEVVRAEDGTPMVEIPFYVDVGWADMDGEPVLFHGVIDGVVRDKTTGDVWVLEHKTAGRAWAQDKFVFEEQGRLYAAALRRLDSPIDPIGVQYNFFYPKRADVKQIYTPESETPALLAEGQAAIWLRDSGSVLGNAGWGGCSNAYKVLWAAERRGEDTSYIRKSQFKVNEERLARRGEVEQAA